MPGTAVVAMRPKSLKIATAGSSDHAYQHKQPHCTRARKRAARHRSSSYQPVPELRPAQVHGVQRDRGDSSVCWVMYHHLYCYTEAIKS